MRLIVIIAPHRRIASGRTSNNPELGRVQRTLCTVEIEDGVCKRVLSFGLPSAVVVKPTMFLRIGLVIKPGCIILYIPVVMHGMPRYVCTAVVAWDVVIDAGHVAVSRHRSEIRQGRVIDLDDRVWGTTTRGSLSLIASQPAHAPIAGCCKILNINQRLIPSAMQCLNETPHNVQPQPLWYGSTQLLASNVAGVPPLLLGAKPASLFLHRRLNVWLSQPYPKPHSPPISAPSTTPTRHALLMENLFR